MLPDDRTLLARAQQTLSEIAESASPDSQAALGHVNIILTELRLRTDRRFLVEHHAEGLALCETGLSLAAATPHAEVIDRGFRSLQQPGDETLHHDSLWLRIDAVRKMLENIVTALIETTPYEKTGGFLDSVVDWENRFHARHSQAASSPAANTETVPSPFTRENILRYLKAKFPDWPDLEVRSLKLLPGGFSKKTLMADLWDARNGEQSLVFRVEHPPRFGFWEGDQVRNEFVVLQLIHEAGLPAPEPLWVENGGDPLQSNPLVGNPLGNPFLVTRRAEGENVGAATGPTANVSRELVEDLLRNLARLHNTPVDMADSRILGSHLAPWLENRTVSDYARAWVEHWSGIVRARRLRPSPTTARILAWLRGNVPVSREPPCLVHGDFGLHNVLAKGDKVSAILDWEYLTIGDPAEDLALLRLSLGSIMDKDEVVALYRKLGGRPISEYRVRYFDVISAMKFIIPCENALAIIQENDRANIALCQFGFQFTYAGVASLNEKIALAEQVKGMQDN